MTSSAWPSSRGAHRPAPPGGIGETPLPCKRPLSAGGLEELIKPIQESLYRRRYGIKNRDRLNRR